MCYYFLLLIRFIFSFNNSVFLSERDTADRNFALAYYMKENECFPKGFILQDCLDFYFQVRLSFTEVINIHYFPRKITFILLFCHNIFLQFHNYFLQTCAMEVNCETIAVMGATLANGGVCPITSEAALGPEAVRDVLSLMHR